MRKTTCDQNCRQRVHTKPKGIHFWVWGSWDDRNSVHKWHMEPVSKMKKMKQRWKTERSQGAKNITHMNNKTANTRVWALFGNLEENWNFKHGGRDLLQTERDKRNQVRGTRHGVCVYSAIQVAVATYRRCFETFGRHTVCIESELGNGRRHAGRNFNTHMYVSVVPWTVLSSLFIDVWFIRHAAVKIQ